MKRKWHNAQKKVQTERTSAPDPDHKSFIVRLAIRLIPAYLLALVFFHVCGPYYAKGIIPVIQYGLDLINPDYRLLEVALNRNTEGYFVQYSAMAHGKVVASGLMASTLYIKPIIVASFIVAIPAMTLRKRLLAAAVGLAGLIPLELLDAPFALSALIDHQYGFMDDSFPQKALLFWDYFLDKGGRIFMALIISIIALLPFYRLEVNTHR